MSVAQAHAAPAHDTSTGLSHAKVAVWTFLASECLLFGALYLNTGPDTGWFAYVPLSGPAFSPGKRVDIWAQMVTFTEIAALVGAIEIIVTVFKNRALASTSGFAS